MKPVTFVLMSASLAAGVAFFTCQTLAQPVDLGVAGSQDWSVLEIGDGNVSLANAAGSGFINGNVGVAGDGTISDGGSLPINGNVNLGLSTGSSGLAGNVSGSINQNAASQAQLNAAVSAAVSAAASASGLIASGGGVGVSSISAGGTLSPGVYNLTSLSLNNGNQLILNGSASSSFVFNISGSLALHSAQILLEGGLSDADVLFNITGNQAVQFSGGLNHESELAGIILAPNAAIQIAPGSVEGEIVSGENINIASGGSVNGSGPVGTVPDTGSSLALLVLGLGLLGLAKKTAFFGLGLPGLRLFE